MCITGIIAGTILICMTAIVIVTLYISRNIFRYLETKNKLRDIELKNKKYELFNSVDTDKIIESIDNYIESYIDRYVLYKFVAPNVPYIKEADQQEMVRTISRNIIIDISELYIYYINLIYSISSDEDLVKFVTTKVKNSTTSICANYNNSNTELL